MRGKKRSREWNKGKECERKHSNYDNNSSLFLSMFVLHINFIAFHWCGFAQKISSKHTFIKYFTMRPYNSCLSSSGMTPNDWRKEVLNNMELVSMNVCSWIESEIHREIYEQVIPLRLMPSDELSSSFRLFVFLFALR